MTATAADRLAQELHAATGRYFRLVLLFGRPGAAEAVLRELSRRTGARRINVSLELSRHLLELPLRERPRGVLSLLEATLSAEDHGPLLLEHLELLFEPSLAQDPLRLLQQLSRTRTLAAVWPGTLEAGHLVYAEPGHPEYYRTSAAELQVLMV